MEQKTQQTRLLIWGCFEEIHQKQTSFACLLHSSLHSWGDPGGRSYYMYITFLDIELSREGLFLFQRKGHENYLYTAVY